MNHQSRFILLSLIFVLMLGSISVTVFACSSDFILKIENQTNRDVSVFINNLHVGLIKPNEIIEVKIFPDDQPYNEPYYEIEAWSGSSPILHNNYSLSELREELDGKLVITSGMQHFYYPIHTPE